MKPLTKLLIFIYFSALIGFPLSRLLPVDAIAFRPWEPLAEDAGSIGAFRINSRIQKDYSYGDLAGLTNRAELRRLRPEQMSTDECGNRGQSYGPRDEIDGYYFGTSFGAGAALNDSETVTEQLYQQSGLRIYNLAQMGLTPEKAKALQNNSLLKKKIVIFEVPERIDPKYAEFLFGAEALQNDPTEVAKDKKSESLTEICQRLRPDLNERLNRLKHREPRLQILAGKVIRRAQNDFLFPQSIRNSGVVTAQSKLWPFPILFLDYDNQMAAKERDPEPMFKTLVRITQNWKKMEFRPVVLLLPAKARVFNSVLPEQFPTSSSYFPEALEKRLQAETVETVNLTSEYLTETKNGTLVFHADDSHWNPHGAGLAARALTKQLLQNK